MIVSDHQAVHEEIGICFHGIGLPGPDLEPGAAEYFISRDVFLAVLDAVAEHPAVNLTFDDGYVSDVAIALPALTERGLTARFFPLAGRLGSPGHVDAADVRALAQAGMTVGSHGMHHRSWRGLDAESVTEELGLARSIIAEASGEPVTDAACPFGAYDRRVLAELRRRGYTAVFTSDRRRARRGGWVQPRYSVRSYDTIGSVLQDVLASPSPRERLRGAIFGRMKAWR